MNPMDILRTIQGKMGGGSQYPEIAQFLASGKNRQEFNTGPYKVYMRSSQRPTEGGGMAKTADLARIERSGVGDNMHMLPPEERPPRGDLSGFMAELERAAAEAGYDQVYVESIFNDFLPGVLERMGYNRSMMGSVFGPGGPPAKGDSMYKKLR